MCRDLIQEAGGSLSLKIKTTLIMEIFINDPLTGSGKKIEASFGITFITEDGTYRIDPDPGGEIRILKVEHHKRDGSFNLTITPKSGNCITIK